MTVLRMKGVRVTSLAEFRKNFDFTNAKDYLREGRLSRWVRELGETELADALAKLNVADCGDEALRDSFIGIFGLDPEVVRPPETAAPIPEEDPAPEEAVSAPGAEAPCGGVRLTIDRDSCVCCGVCVGACPVEAIKFDDEKIRIDEDACVRCGSCVGECPANALSLE